MKRERLVTTLTGFVLACLLSFGAMGSMISGLDLPVDAMANLHTAWIIAAMAGCALFSFKKGWLLALWTAVLGLGYLWEYHYLSLPIRALITRLSWLYDSAYGWGILEFAGVAWRSASLDLILGTWGCLVALAAAGTVVGGRGMTLTLILALLPVGSTLVVTNTAPDAPYVFAVMLSVILLVLTSTVRRHSPHQGAKLALLTGLPVTLLLWALFAAYPQDTYVNQSQEYLNSVVHWWQSRVATAWDTSGLLGQSAGAADTTHTTNLNLLGPRANWRYPVMDVTSANESGTIYLRGQDYDVYDGSSWTATPDREERWRATWENGNTITVTTRRQTDRLYLPYYTAGVWTLSGGRADNGDHRMEYSFNQAGIPAYLLALMRHPSENAVFTRADGISDVYLSLPGDTRTWAEDYLTAQVPNWTTINGQAVEGVYKRSNTQIADMIAEHVLGSARYDKGTPRMDGDYEDFAQWFLEESDTGYCVHFATAAAVLLRASGVPARYVTGYMFQAEAGETTTVRADRAHAWVEYYEPLVGNWVILEATPPDLGDTQTQPTEATDATEETEPPTEETTAPPTEDEGQTHPPAATQPGGKDTPKLDLTPLWTALKWLLAALGLWLAVLAQYHLRRDRRHRGSPNARALAKWQNVALLCRVTRQTPPEDLEHLAQKAKFSQHTLTSDELRAFDTWFEVEQAKPRPWYLQLLCKYVLALW